MSERQNAIITGGASGLGRALALRLARDGWRIAICDINDAAAESVRREVDAAGGEGRAERLDVTKPEEWGALRDRLQADWKALDLLVNNAGVAGSGDVGQYSLADWKWLLDVNLWSGVYGCHTFVEWLKRNPRGAHILNTASMAAIGSAPGMAAYNVSKSGIVALSETLYAELLPHNVGVTALCPAFVPTNLLVNARFVRPEEKKWAEKAFRDSKITPDYVADQAVKAMRAKRLYCILPAEGRRYWYLKRLAPQWFMGMVARLREKQLAEANSVAEGVRQPVG